MISHTKSLEALEGGTVKREWFTAMICLILAFLEMAKHACRSALRSLIRVHIMRLLSESTYKVFH